MYRLSIMQKGRIYTDEKQLIFDLKKGDEKCFTYLVDTYSHRLCIYVNSLIGDMTQAEDIVQNVFVKIWEKKHLLNEDLKIKNLLYKYAYNEFVDQYRKQKSTLKLEKQHIELLHEVLDEEDNQSIKKVLDIVMKAIQELPPKCKQTILLSKQEGLTNVEISEFQDVSIRTVEKQLSKAYKRLRDKLSSIAQFSLFLFL